MKKYISFIVLFISVFGFSIAFASSSSVTINSVSAIVSNPGYISNSGKSNIIVTGTALSGSIVMITLTDRVNNNLTVSKIVSSDNSYIVSLDGTLATPNPLIDGLIMVSANTSGSTSSPATATIIQETALPSVTVLGDDPFICQVRACLDLGVVSYDSLGNKVTNISSTTNININTAGNYTTRYTVTDLAGNQNIASRRVTVVTRNSGLSTTTIDTSTIVVPSQISVVPPVYVPVTDTSMSTTTTATATVQNQPTSTQSVVEIPSVTVIKVSGLSEAVKRQLRLGVSGADVKLLQTVLSHDQAVYPEGLTTGYYGNLTRLAVQRFQEKYNIATKGAPGYGEVGPKTKAKLIEIYGM